MAWRRALLLSLATISLWGQESASAIFDHARQLYGTQGALAALPEFERARAAYQDAHDLAGEAKALNAIGISYNRLGEPKKALAAYQSALSIKERVGDPDEIGKTVNNMSRIYAALADYSHASSGYRRALTLAKQARDQELEGAVENNLGQMLMDQGSYTEARERLKRALALKNNDAIENLGSTYQLLGRNHEALTYLEKYLDLKRGTADEGFALGNLALCHLGLGEISEALRLYDRAIALAQKGGERAAEADWRKGRGSALQRAGRYDDALAEYRQALETYDRAGVKQKKVELLADLGYLHLALGDFIEAEKQFRAALALAQSINDRRSVIADFLALGDLQWRRKQYTESLRNYQSALDRARQAGDRMNTAGGLVDLAVVSRDRGRYSEASAEAGEALAVAREIGARLMEAQALYILGELERLQRQPEAALSQYTAGEAIVRDSGDTELEWRLAFGMGQALLALGRKDEAIAACRHAAAVVESVRGRLREDRFQAGYIEDKYQVYVLLVKLLLESGQLAEAFEFAERLHARSYAELIGQGRPRVQPAEEIALRERVRHLQHELEVENGKPKDSRRADAAESYARELADAERAYEDFLDDLRSRDPRYAAAHLLAAPKAQKVQRELPAGTALLEYMVSEDGITAFVMTSRRIHAQQLRMKRRDLNAKVELMRDLIARPQNDDWRDPAASLGTALVTPLEQKGWLAGIARIYIVPHQVLHYIPFAVLPRGTRLLGDDYTIAYLPAAAALFDNGLAASCNGGCKGLLAMAPSRSGLQHAGEEVQAVQGLFPRGNLVLIGQSATEAVFKEQAPVYDILHVATHASFNRLRPMFSALQMERGGTEDGELEVREILELRLNASLVTLSACSTAMASGYFADMPAGDDLVGFTRAFLYAGSRSVLASLWDVDDLSTSLLMREFYARLGKMDKARALAAAQQEIRRNPKYQHPYYWAPFILSGKMN